MTRPTVPDPLPENPSKFVCGTRKVVRRGTRWAIVCATCDGGGSVLRTREEAISQCVKASGNHCRICGAR